MPASDSGPAAGAGVVVVGPGEDLVGDEGRGSPGLGSAFAGAVDFAEE
jgi:hypothetical protein